MGQGTFYRSQAADPQKKISRGLNTSAKPLADKEEDTPHIPLVHQRLVGTRLDFVDFMRSSPLGGWQWGWSTSVGSLMREIPEIWGLHPAPRPEVPHP